MRAAPAKFLFDTDFAAGGESKPSIPLADHAIKLKEAEAGAYARGFAAAEAAARVSAEQATAAAFERMAATLQGLDRNLAAVEARLASEAIDVAVAVGSKLAPELIAREPMAEIAALASECFRHLVATPHVVVRIHDSLLAATRERLEDIVRNLGLGSRLVVLSEPDIAPGDCRIEWADGGIVRDSAATAATIKDAVTRYVEARRTAAAMPGLSESEFQGERHR